MRRPARVVPVSVIGAIAFGVSEGVLWSDGNATGFWLGNISSTYLLLGFVGGWVITARQTPMWAGPLHGLVVSIAALVGFYGWQLHHLSLSSSGVQTGLIRYGTGAVVSGPLFGLLGALWARRRAWCAVAAVGVAFLLEPLAWRVRYGFQLMPAGVRALEFVVGCTVLVLGAISTRRRAGRPRSRAKPAGA